VVLEGNLEQPVAEGGIPADALQQFVDRGHRLPGRRAPAVAVEYDRHMAIRTPLGRVSAWATRHERWLWAVVVAVVVAIQWPMLKGLYYRTTGSASPPAAIAWRTDLDAALREAQAAGKPVFVDFAASWCPPCIVMQHDVWPDRRVTTILQRDYIPVHIDVDRDGATAARYGVEGIPTLLVLDGGGAVQRTASYMSASALANWLQDTGR
jgi:thiol:disulfide interchange protein